MKFTTRHVIHITGGATAFWRPPARLRILGLRRTEESPVIHSSVAPVLLWKCVHLYHVTGCNLSTCEDGCSTLFLHSAFFILHSAFLPLPAPGRCDPGVAPVWSRLCPHVVPVLIAESPLLTGLSQLFWCVPGAYGLRGPQELAQSLPAGSSERTGEFANSYHAVYPVRPGGGSPVRRGLCPGFVKLNRFVPGPGIHAHRRGYCLPGRIRSVTSPR